jgi:hypothetical protein
MPNTVAELGVIGRAEDMHEIVDAEGVPYLKVGWLVRFDPAEITVWLDGARHPERSTAGDRTRLGVGFSRSASRVREIGCLDSRRQTDCARLGDLPLVVEDLRDALE